MSPNKSIEGHLLEIEWLVADVTAVGAPDRAEQAILGMMLAEQFFVNSTCISGQGAIL